jgi:diguanylate cyclase (GGDEF)-like protein
MLFLIIGVIGSNLVYTSLYGETFNVSNTHVISLITFILALVSFVILNTRPIDKSETSDDKTSTGVENFDNNNWNIDPDTLEEAVILTCPRNLVLKANKAAIEMFEKLFNDKSIINLEFAEVFDILHSNLEERTNADQVLEAVLQNPSLQYREMLRLKDGRFIERVTRPYYENGCRIWYMHDLTYLMQAKEDQALHDTMVQEEAVRTAEMAEQLYLAKAKLEKNQRELTRLANTDSLTGLNNRRHFMELANNAILDMSSLFEIWVIMLDIDHFKKINDNYGHSAGDTAIRLFSETVTNCIGSRGEIGRMGGEEFAVYLPGVNKSDTEQFAEDIRQHVEELNITHENISFQFTTSIGIAKILSEEWSIEAALDRADEALYIAKTSGRNCIKIA